MTPSFIIEKMDSEWKKAVAHTKNFMETIKNAPFSEHIKDTMLAALKCTIELLEENERLRDALERIRDCDFVITLPDRMDAVRKIAREALQFESCTQNNKASATVIPEAQSFYYDAKSNVLAYCDTGRIHWGDVSLRKVNEADVDTSDASCSLEYFKKHFKKVAFIQAREVLQ
jgi:hypothetical protein